MSNECLINIKLVAKGLRSAYLPDDGEKVDSELWESALALAKELSVKYLLTLLGIFVFVKDEDVCKRICTDVDLGKELGFYAWNHRYWDPEINRVSIRVVETTTDSEITVEVCYAKKIAEAGVYYMEKVEAWNNAFYAEYHFETRMEIIKAALLMSKRVTYRYFEKYRKEYEKWISSMWIEKSRFLNFIKDLDEENFNLYWPRIQIFFTTIKGLYEVIKRKSYTDIIIMDIDLWNFIGMPDNQTRNVCRF